jgi:hypothetical protein
MSESITRRWRAGGIHIVILRFVDFGSLSRIVCRTRELFLFPTIQLEALCRQHASNERGIRELRSTDIWEPDGVIGAIPCRRQPKALRLYLGGLR